MNSENRADVFVKGALVQTLWNTGAFGLDILYGVVIASGGKTVTIRWVSGIVNRIRRGYAFDRDIKLASDQDAALAALANIGSTP